MPEKPKTKNQIPKTKIIWLIFALVIIFIYFFGLTIPLLGPDEPRYAQIAREMLERADWVTPKLGGFDWFEKPALLYWLEIVSYKLFGINEFAARFGSALCGLGTIACLWILGKFSAAENTGKSREIEKTVSFSANSADSAAQADFANWLALAAASSIGLIVFSRAASFDIVLTFPLTGALVSFFIFDQNERCAKTKKQTNFSFSIFSFPLSVFYVGIGIALIAKGLVGIVFPFAIVAFYYVLSWKFPSKTFVLSLFWGTILTLCVAAIWYLPMYQTNGWKFVDEFIIQHHFQRFTSDKYQHHQPFWFFFVVLPLMTIPWLPFFAASIWELFKVQGSRFKVQSAKFKVQSSNSTNESPRYPVAASPILLFSLSWLFVPLVFFSISGSKLPGYILPALPAAIILTAEYIFRFARKSQKRKAAIHLTALLTFAAVAFLLQFAVVDFTRNDTVKNLIETADAKGFGDAKIVNLYTVSHNLEFYAPNRLVRENDGKLKRYDDFSILVRDAKTDFGGTILVLVPQKDAPNLNENGNTANVEILAENGESAIAAITAK